MNHEHLVYLFKQMISFNGQTVHQASPNATNLTTDLLFSDTFLGNISGDATVPPREFVKIFQVPVGLVVLLSIFYGAVSLVAVSGNLCVLWVVSRRRMRTVTNNFIGNLALADIIIGLFAVPLQFQAALLQRWVLPAFLCAFCPFVQVLSVNVSVFTLVAIAFDRYRSVFRPFDRRGTSKMCVKLGILSIWLTGAIAACPHAVVFRVTLAYDPQTDDYTRPFCTNIVASNTVWATYHYALVILQYVLPLCLVSYAYGRMAFRLRSEACPKASRDEVILKSKRKVSRNSHSISTLNKSVFLV